MSGSDGNDIARRITALSCPADADIRGAMEAINRGALGVAILCEGPGGRLRGLVTDGDIRRALLAGKGLNSPAADIANRLPLTARTDDPPEKTAALLSERSRFIPVLDAEGRVRDLAYYDKRSHLPVADAAFGQEEVANVMECVLTGWVSSAGKFVTEFERSFAAFCGVPHAVAVCNGTCALHLALVALGLGPGDEVIVPSLSFIASANSVAYTGATPVFADSEPGTWNIDPEQIERLITPRTRAIMPVHLYGHPADMTAIMAIARRRGLAVIEDAAEAHGARWEGRRVGAIGDLGCFSFYGNKIVTTGEGGMVVTERQDLAERMRMLRDHGMSPQRRYWHPVLGYNYRLTNLQAALGVAQMGRIDATLARKREVGAAYASALRGIPGLSWVAAGASSWPVYWLNSILVDPAEFGMDRDALMSRLRELGIETRPVFPVLHRQPIYDRAERLPVAEGISARGLSLPSAANLTPAEVVRVAEAVARARK